MCIQRNLTAVESAKPFNFPQFWFPLYLVSLFLCRIDDSQDKEKLRLFRGQLTIRLEQARKGISYKYVIVEEGNVHWEKLPEFPPKCVNDSIVNRFLKIPDKYIKAGGK